MSRSTLTKLHPNGNNTGMVTETRQAMSSSCSEDYDESKPGGQLATLHKTKSRASTIIENEDWAAGQGSGVPPNELEAGIGMADQGFSDAETTSSVHRDTQQDNVNVVQRVLSRITTKSSIDPGPPPDGGARAWAQCLAAHLVIFNTWGWANSFGTFQTYYATTLDRPPADISWIGSLNVFLLFFIGAFTGRLTDAGYFRPLMIFGSIFAVFGIFMTSLCTTYWQLLLAQGLCMGLAHGCIFCPTMAVLSTYFHKKRGLVLGIAACGSATGGLVFPSMVRQLLPTAGFGWTVRAIGFVQMVLLFAANLLLKTRIRPRKAGPLIELQAFKELDYTFYAAAAFFNFWGVYFAFFYLPAFSRDALQPPLSYPESLNLLLILNGVGIIGRIIPNYIADRVGPVNVFIPTSAVASMLMFCFIAIRNPVGLYVWSIIYGIIAAGIQSLFPAALALLTPDLRKLGVRMGMIFTIVSFAVLTGPPVAGAIVASAGGYTGAKAFAGCSIAIGCLFLIAAKATSIKKTGSGWRSKT